MRCLSAIAVLLVLAALPMAAQRGGGGHGFSGGGHSGGFASHGSFGGSHFSGGGHAFSGVHSASGLGARSFSRGAYSNRSFSNRSFARGLISRGSIARNGIASRNSNQFNRGFNRGFNNGGTHFNIRTRGFGAFGNCIGYPCRGWGYAWGSPYLWGGIDPYWWWDNSGYDQDQQNEIAQAQQMDQDSLADQQMRQQYEQNQYARSAPPPPPQQPERTDPGQPTVLIFRDQHQQEVQNYAIVGQTIWTFAPQKTQKIPLSDLDIPATTKANDERGVDFRLPNSGEGQ
jgi:hypothetical protein